MPVYEQGYRRYEGPRTTRSSVIAIAVQNVRTRLRWWAWALLVALSVWPFAFYGVLVWMLTVGSEHFPKLPTRGAVANPVAFADGGHFNPANVLAMVESRPLHLVWHLLDSSSYAALMFPAVVAAGLLASDRRTGALQIYFARAVTRLDYLLGKILAGTVFVALATAVPTFLVWMEVVAFSPLERLTWQTWAAPFVILGASAFYALWSVSVVLCLSSLLRRPAVVGIAAVGTLFLLELVGAILGKTLHDDAWTVLQPTRAVGAITALLCGLDLPPWMNLPAAFGLAVALPAALLALVAWRIRAVEVAT